MTHITNGVINLNQKNRDKYWSRTIADPSIALSSSYGLHDLAPRIE